eukprot:13842826-Alexandrium_andersonii.AAC.1
MCIRDRTPAALMASPSVLLGSFRGPPWPSSGQRGSARAASAWRTCCGGSVAREGGPAARAYEHVGKV